MIITDVHEEIEAHHQEHADDQTERKITFRVLNFSGQKGDVVPTVIGPERAQHRGRKTGKASGGDRYPFTRAAGIWLGKMRPVSVAVKKSAQADTYQQQDFN